MKLCHNAALETIGWYLMVPPNPFLANSGMDAPVSQWEIMDSFNKAAECAELGLQVIGKAEHLLEHWSWTGHGNSSLTVNTGSTDVPGPPGCCADLPAPFRYPAGRDADGRERIPIPDSLCSINRAACMQSDRKEKRNGVLRGVCADSQ